MDDWLPQEHGLWDIFFLVGSQKDREHIREQLAVVGQTVSDFERKANHPLPDRNVLGEDIVHQPGRRVGHSSAGA